MRKNKKNNKNSPDPYEDTLRLHKLNPYEALIKLNVLTVKDNK